MLRNCASKARASVYLTVLMVMSVVVISLRRAVRMVWIWVFWMETATRIILIGCSGLLVEVMVVARRRARRRPLGQA
jgi:hypothetical protein